MKAINGAPLSYFSCFSKEYTFIISVYIALTGVEKHHSFLSQHAVFTPSPPPHPPPLYVSMLSFTLSFSHIFIFSYPFVSIQL